MNHKFESTYKKGTYGKRIELNIELAVTPSSEDFTAIRRILFTLERLSRKYLDEPEKDLPKGNDE